jgi:hypothetical protein
MPKFVPEIVRLVLAVGAILNLFKYVMAAAS